MSIIMYNYISLQTVKADVQKRSEIQYKTLLTR